MSVSLEDPLVAAMTVAAAKSTAGPVPLRESCRRLRALSPQCPRLYGVAVLDDVSRRRWWPLAEVLDAHRLPSMVAEATAGTASRYGATRALAATLAHVVLGRVLPLVITEGRAWDPGLENLWVHVDSGGTIDWVAVADPTLRVLPGADCVAPGAAVAAGAMTLPSEAALLTWVAHRGHRTLDRVFARLADVTAGSFPVWAMWHAVGSAVVGAATAVPALAGCSAEVGMRRGQGILDALTTLGAPVRGPDRSTPRSARGPGRGTGPQIAGRPRMPSVAKVPLIY